MKRFMKTSGFRSPLASLAPEHVRNFMWQVVLCTSLVGLAIGSAELRVTSVMGEWGMLAVLAAAVLTPAMVVIGWVALRADEHSPRARLILSCTCGGVVALLLFDLTGGRVLRAALIRWPLVVGASLAIGSAGHHALPRLAALARRSPVLTATIAVCLAWAALLLDRRAMPRAYPAFHLGLEAGAAVAAAVGAASLARWIARCADGSRPARRTLDVLGAAGLTATILTSISAPKALRHLARREDLRHAFAESSPLLRSLVVLAVRVSPPIRTHAEVDLADPLASAPEPMEHAPALRDVLLVTIDALRADHVGAYGYRRQTTPFLDSLARSGVLFRNAYTAAPQTSYAITSLMTGTYARSQPTLDATRATFAGLLGARGYRTVALYPEAVFFTDADRFTEVASRRLGFDDVTLDYANASERVDQIAALLAESPASQPLFLWTHLFEPHAPYEIYEGHAFGDGDIDRYDGEVAFADAALGKIVARFRSVRPNGIVIVTADHGEAFGEHGALFHGTTLYEEQVHVPLVVVGDGLSRREVEEPVQTIDVLPTVLAMLGLPPPLGIRGRNLLARMRGEPFDDGIAFAELPHARMIARGTHRLLCDQSTAACALFDLASDPGQQHPILDDPRRAALQLLMAGIVAGNARHATRASRP